MNIQPGSLIDDRYEILENLAGGGFGSIFKAQELSLQRIVALKFIHADLISPKLVARFEREGKVLSTLSHPNIVSFYRFGVLGNEIPYIAMEFIEGKSLRSLIDETAILPFQQSITIAIQICDGLAAAHLHGIVHRDLKPGNIIMMEENKVKLVDFGLAKMTTQEAIGQQQLTQTGAMIGSIYYMSPEQCRGSKIDHRADIYALGCVLYEMLTGVTPFVAETTFAVIRMHLQDTPGPVLKVAQSDVLPCGLNNMLMKALCKDPEQRFQSAQEMKQALLLLQDGRGNEIAPIRTDYENNTEWLSLNQHQLSKGTRFRNALLFSLLCFGALAMVTIWRMFHHPVSTIEPEDLRNNVSSEHSTPKRVHRVVDSRDAVQSLRIIYTTLPNVINDKDASSRLVQAEREVTKIMKECPDLARPRILQTHLLLGWIYRLMYMATPSDVSSLDKAERAYLSGLPPRPAEEIHMDNVIYAELADVFVAKHDYQNAASCYQRALKLLSLEPSVDYDFDMNLSPGTESDESICGAKFHLGWCERILEHWQIAEKYLREARQESISIGTYFAWGVAITATGELCAVMEHDGRVHECRELMIDTEKRLDRDILERSMDNRNSLRLFLRLLSFSNDLDFALRVSEKVVKLCEQPISGAENTDFDMAEKFLTGQSASAVAAHRADLADKFVALKKRLEMIAPRARPH